MKKGKGNEKKNKTDNLQKCSYHARPGSKAPSGPFFAHGPPVRAWPAPAFLASATTLVNGSLGRGSRSSSHDSGTCFTTEGCPPCLSVVHSLPTGSPHGLTLSLSHRATTPIGQALSPVALTPRLWGRRQTDVAVASEFLIVPHLAHSKSNALFQRLTVYSVPRMAF